MIVRLPTSNGAGHPGRIADLLVGRPEDGPHRLLEDQRQAPGGEQRLQRPAVEEADDAAFDGDADGAGDEEGERNGDGERPVEQPRRAGADHLLDDEGRVGAEHDHLAMGHVDDAHHAEGDGKADGGQQQDRAEGDAVPDVLRRVPESEFAVDGGKRGGGGGGDRPLAGGQRGQQRQHVAPAAVLEDLDGGDLLLVGKVGLENGRGARLAASGAAREGSFSAARAASISGMAAGSPLWKTDATAVRRTAGSGLISVREPSAVRMTPRSLLLTLILSISPLAASPAAAPVTGSVSAKLPPADLGDEDLLVGLADVEVAGGKRVEHGGGNRVAGRREGDDGLFGLEVAAGAERRDQWADIARRRPAAEPRRRQRRDRRRRE